MMRMVRMQMGQLGVIVREKIVILTMLIED